LALPEDDKSITAAVKLQHYKDFCAALNAAEPEKKAKVLEFRRNYNQKGLQDDEKGWVKVIGTAVQRTGKSIADSFTYAISVKQKLNTSNMDVLRDAIDKLRSHVSAWLDTFNVGANMVGSLGVIATILGTDNVAWIASVPAGARTLNPIKLCLEGMKAAQFKNADIRNLWLRFPAVDALVVWELGEKSPAALYAAYKHIEQAAPDPFWMNSIADPARASSVAQKVYADNSYETKAKPTNAVALRLTTTIDQAWVPLFTCSQLVDIHEKLIATGSEPLTAMFFSTAGTIAGTHTQVANTPEFQTWIAGRCDIVAKLAHAGYPITAIVKMFRENMNERLMISSTWFRRQPITDSLDFFIRVWVDPNNHAEGTIHGGLTANGAHLAVRHLYENFNFDLPDSIKAQNSFHPKGTKVNDLVQLANGLTLAHKHQDSLQLVNGYYVAVTNHSDEAKRRVKSLYPSLANTNPHYYTRAEMESIRDVLKEVQSKLLPAL